MIRWQGRTRFALALFLGVFGILVFMAIRERRIPERPPEAFREDPDAIVESTGAIVTQARGARQDFKLEAERQLTYASGATKLEGVKVTVLERAGRDFEVTGRAAAIGEDRSQIDMNGDVRLAASDGLTATTERAVYSDQEGLLRVPGFVEFARGRMSGSGLGATYDRNRDVLWLLQQARVTFTPDEQGGGGTDIAAGAAGLARRDRYLRFEHDVRIVRPDRIIEAETAMAYLGETEDRVEMLELKGNARISATDGNGSARLKGMVAEAINLSYAEDGALSRATLAQNARVELAGAAGEADRGLTADWIDIVLAADGITLTSLVARDEVRLDLPASATTPARRIRADALESQGDTTGLRMASFGGDVLFHEVGSPTDTSPGFDRTARAQTLELSLNGGFDAMTDARFGGETRFEADALRADAPAALYRLATGVIELSAGDQPEARPIVVDDGTEIEAAQITVTLAGTHLAAQGDVRTTRPPQAATTADTTPGRTPGMLRGDQTVYITGQQLAYEGEVGRAVYTGNARLWQGETAVQGDTIELDEALGDLTATGSARSSLMFEEMNEETQTIEQVASIASATAMHYEDAFRRITYDTSAHVTGPQGDLTADKVEMYLGETSSALERAEAYDSVELKSPVRTAKGERMTYFTADARYVMDGTPVTILEPCRETKGKTLTFYKSTDTISVGGNEEVRTESTAGTNCPEPPGK